METLKFLFLSTFYPPNHVGGDAIAAQRLAEELANRGHEVHVISQLDCYIRKKRGAPIIETKRNGVIIHQLKSPISHLYPIAVTISGRPIGLETRMKKIMNEISPDIVHHHSPEGFGPWSFRIKGKKTVYTAHDYWSICPCVNLLKPGNELCLDKKSCIMCQIQHPRPPQLWRIGHSIIEDLNRMDLVIAPSIFMQKTLIENGLKVKTEVIPSFIKDPKPSLNNQEAAYHQILFVGRIEKSKGLDLLLKGFAIISQHDSDLRLAIVGEGPMKEEFRYLGKKLGIENKVNWRGWISEQELINEYEKTIVTVLPSTWFENSPCVAVESLAHGTPIMGADIGGIPEMVRQVDHRLLFKEFDPNDFAEKYLSVRDELVNLRKRARQTFLESYTQRLAVDKYISAISN